MDFRSPPPRRRGRFLFFPLVAGVAALALGGAVMGLWNAILPEALHAGRLTYWQGVGLLVLCRLLFGSFGSFGGPRRPGAGGPAWGRPNHQEKWLNMSEEERQRFRQRWQARGGRHRGWGPPPAGAGPAPGEA